MARLTMKTMTWQDYGAIDQIQIIDIDVPVPKAANNTILSLISRHITLLQITNVR